jgi:predicted dehydrogenase
MSVAPFRLGVAGLSHGHVWGLIDSFAAVPEVRLAAIADDSDLLDTFLPRFDRSYSTWQEMLGAGGLDGVLVTSNTLESSEITVQALERGLHVFLEKPMATNSADADRMLAAWQASGKVLMVNWPIAWNKGLREFDRLVQDGVGGVPFHFKFRAGHRGPKEIGCGPEFTNWLYDEELNGGGAIADFGNYGAALARWYLGMPDSVAAAAGNYTKEEPVSDDHAVILMRYPRASAVVEGTWATMGFESSANPVLHGSKGTLGVFENEIEVVSLDSRVRHSAPDLEVTSPAIYFLNCVATNTQPEGILDPFIAADGVRIVAAARRSLQTGSFEVPK